MKKSRDDGPPQPPKFSVLFALEKYRLSKIGRRHSEHLDQLLREIDGLRPDQERRAQEAATRTNGRFGARHAFERPVQ
jgi:hypothetical protein